jgi:hypothetical protein
MERILVSLMFIGSAAVSGFTVAYLASTPAAPALFAIAATAILLLAGDAVRDVRRMIRK